MKQDKKKDRPPPTHTENKSGIQEFTYKATQTIISIINIPTFGASFNLNTIKTRNSMRT